VDDGDLEALPDLVYDAYMSGRLLRVGTVAKNVKQNAQPSSIQRAHRNNETMKTLPKITLKLSIDAKR
jgi:hypothetical protein